MAINSNKTEFIAVNTDKKFHINIKQVQNFKYLDVIGIFNTIHHYLNIWGALPKKFFSL